MKVSSTIGTVFGLLLLLAILAGVYFGFQYIVNVFARLDPQLETLAAIASVVALVCAVIIAEGLKACRPIDAVTAAEKGRIYGELLSVCCAQLRQGGAGGSVATADLAKLEKSLVLHGAARVISAYADARRLAGQHDKTEEAVATQLVKLVTEMRADLGYAALVRHEGEVRDMLSGRS